MWHVVYLAGDVARLFGVGFHPPLVWVRLGLRWHTVSLIREPPTYIYHEHVKLGCISFDDEMGPVKELLGEIKPHKVYYP